MAEQHFTQPPPRYSEASLVKKMEELGIGRPSTYAAILQTLKDRDYVRLEKNRFIPEESGRLLTAFLERFFERYVSYDFTAHLEDELDDISGGRAEWQEVLEAFWRDFKPKTAEVMEQKPSEITAALDDFLAPWLFPDKGDGTDAAAVPGLRRGPAGAARRPLRRLRRLLQLSRMQVHPPLRPGRRGGRRRAGRQVLGTDPETGRGRSACETGRFGPYVQLGEGKEAKRASIPKDVPQASSTSSWRCGCCRCRGRSAPIRRAASRSPPHRPLRPLSRP